jgi:hypothetical protein
MRNRLPMMPMMETASSKLADYSSECWNVYIFCCCKILQLLIEIVFSAVTLHRSTFSINQSYTFCSCLMSLRKNKLLSTHNNIYNVNTWILLIFRHGSSKICKKFPVCPSTILVYEGDNNVKPVNLIWKNVQCSTSDLCLSPGYIYNGI